MPGFEVQTPTGEKYRLDYPEGTDPSVVQQKLAAFKEHLTAGPTTSPTTTPTTRTFPQAVGETARAFGRRTMEGEQAFEQSIREGDVRGMVGGAAQGIFPAIPGGPAMMLGGAT